jgi:hypothetical protein
MSRQLGNDESIGGYELQDYVYADPEEGDDEVVMAYRIAVEYDDDEGLGAVFDHLLQNPNVSELRALSIGNWGNEWSDTPPLQRSARAPRRGGARPTQEP